MVFTVRTQNKRNKYSNNLLSLTHTENFWFSDGDTKALHYTSEDFYAQKRFIEIIVLYISNLRPNSSLPNK